MANTTFPPALVDLQRRVHAAWDAVEAHRKAVDAWRVAEADAADQALRAAGERVAEVPTRGRRPLPPWAPEDDQEHARLLVAATAAAQALRAGVTDAGLDGGYDVVQGLHKAARGE